MPRDPFNPIDRHIGARLRAARVSRGMSLTKLAAAAGLSYQQVQKYESGHNSVSPRYLVVFAENLDVPVAEFFRESAVDHIADGQNRMRAPAKIDLEILDLLGNVDNPTKIAWRNLLRTIVEA